MITKDPFMGSLASAIDKVICSDNNITTMAVGPTPSGDRAYLYYNEKFWDELELARGECESKDKFAIREHKMKFKLGLLYHEMLHLLFEHLTSPDTKDKDKMLCNMAMDLYINQLIGRDNLPNSSNLTEEYMHLCGLHLQEFNEKLNPDEEPWKEHESWLYYYNKLISKKNSLNEQYNIPKTNITIGNNDVSIESDAPDYKTEGDEFFHKLLNSFDQDVEFVDGETGEKITNQVMRLVEETWNDLSSKDKEKSRGFGQGLYEKIVEMFSKRKKPVTNWKNALKVFLQSSISDPRCTTLMRRSKRFPGAAGSKRKLKCKIVVAIDTSGSVTDEDLAMAFNEIKFIAKAGAEIEIMQCDTNCYNPYKYKPNDKVVKLQGRGGTEFQPVFDYYRNKNIDGLIYITDGYCNAPDTYKIRTTWLLVPSGLDIKTMKENNFKGLIIKMEK
jgi:predicted metal-dependent peptidase